MNLPAHALLLIFGLSGPPVPGVAELPKVYDTFRFCEQVATSVRLTLVERGASAFLVRCVPTRAEPGQR